MQGSTVNPLPPRITTGRKARPGHYSLNQRPLQDGETRPARYSRKIINQPCELFKNRVYPDAVIINTMDPTLGFPF
jgi:hypothetical protein